MNDNIDPRMALDLSQREQIAKLNLEAQAEADAEARARYIIAKEKAMRKAFRGVMPPWKRRILAKCKAKS